MHGTILQVGDCHFVMQNRVPHTAYYMVCTLLGSCCRVLVEADSSLVASQAV